MKPPHVHYLEHSLLEAHSITPHVCVIYPLKRWTRTSDDPDGRHHLIHSFDRDGPPYIAFARVDVGKKGKKELTVESPAAHAMTTAIAAQLAQGLADAVDYIEKVKLDGSATLPAEPSPRSQPAS